MAWIAVWIALAPVAAAILLLDLKLPGFTHAQSPITAAVPVPTHRRGAGVET